MASKVVSWRPRHEEGGDRPETAPRTPARCITAGRRAAHTCACKGREGRHHAACIDHGLDHGARRRGWLRLAAGRQTLKEHRYVWHVQRSSRIGGEKARLGRRSGFVRLASPGSTPIAGAFFSSLTPPFAAGSQITMANDSKQDLETRKASAASIRAKHPDRIPVIVDKRSSDSSIPDIDKVHAHPCAWWPIRSCDRAPVLCRRCTLSHVDAPSPLCSGMCAAEKVPRAGRSHHRSVHVCHSQGEATPARFRNLRERGTRERERADTLTADHRCRCAPCSAACRSASSLHPNRRSSSSSPAARCHPRWRHCRASMTSTTTRTASCI